MFADAMTKRNDIPLTGRICVIEEAATFERHQLQPASRSSSSRVDPAAQSNDTQSRSE